jgi:hypothetical protein
MPKARMWVPILITVALFAGLSLTFGLMRREEIKGNWSQYRGDLLYMFAAPLFKPDDDKRSRFEFATDNFREVVKSNMTKLFGILLAPLFQIFKLLMNATGQSLQGIFNTRSILSKMWNKFNEMIDIFMRRFYEMFHRLRVTFVGLNHAMSKAMGAAVGSIYSGLSLMSAIFSTMDLVVTVCMGIALSLIPVMLFTPWAILPFLGLIVPTIMFAKNSGYQGDLDFLIDVFCFEAETPVQTIKGTHPIKEIAIGTQLANGAGTVTGRMEFNVHTADMYELHGVKVTGSHIVYSDAGKPMFVYEHPAARKLPASVVTLYSLTTSSRRIPVQSNKGTLMFADWEELAADDDQLKQWNTHVFQALNGRKPMVQTPSSYNSEAVFHPNTQVKMADHSYQPIQSIRPGDRVCGAAGQPTRVRGIVAMSTSEVCAAVNGKYSAGVWIHDHDGVWSQPVAHTPPPPNQQWVSLVTDAGMFIVDGVGPVRDFTDVGSEHIHQTYDWVLGKLMPSKE